VLESLAPQAAHLLSQLPLLGSSRWAGEQRTELSKLETGTVQRCSKHWGCWRCRRHRRKAQVERIVKCHGGAERAGATAATGAGATAAVFAAGLSD